MRIQIVNSATGEVIFTPRTNATLETDLLELFDRGHPWWRPLARRRYRLFCAEVHRVTAELRHETIYAAGQ